MFRDIGLLILRSSFALLMIFPHGWGKLINFSARMNTFPDPIGFGSPVSLSLTVFSEVFCAFALLIGFKTRWASVPLIITMLVAGVVIHGNDPWKIKEKAFVYLFAYLAIAFTGPGKFSIDNMVFKDGDN